MLARENDSFHMQLHDADSLLHQMEKNVVFEVISFLRRNERHLSATEKQHFKELLREWKIFLLHRYFPLAFRLAEEAGFVPVPDEHVPARYRQFISHEWPGHNLESVINVINNEKPLLSVLRTPSLRRIPSVLLSPHDARNRTEPNDHLVVLYNPEAPDKNWATLALHLRKNTKESVTAELKYSEGITKLDVLILLASLLGVYFSVVQEAFMIFLQDWLYNTSGITFTLTFPQLVGMLGVLVFMAKIFQIIISFIMGKRKIGKLITRNKKVMKSRLDSSTTLLMLSYYQRKRKATWARAVFKVIMDRNGADMDEIQRELATRWEIFKDWATLQRFMSRLEALEWIFQDNTGTWNVPRGKVIGQPEDVLDDQLKDSFDLPIDLQATIRECHSNYLYIRNQFENLANAVNDRLKHGNR